MEERCASSKRASYRRTLRNVGPVRGSANGNQVELSRTGSPAAGDSESGQHREGDDEGWIDD